MQDELDTCKQMLISSRGPGAMAIFNDLLDHEDLGSLPVSKRKVNVL